MDAPTLYTENISCLIQTYFPVWSWPRAKWWQLSSQTVVRANSESTLPKETKHDFLTNGTLLVILISTHRVCIICNGKMEYVITVDPTESVVMEATSGQLKVIRELLCDDLRKKKKKVAFTSDIYNDFRLTDLFRNTVFLSRFASIRHWIYWWKVCFDHCEIWLSCIWKSESRQRRETSLKRTCGFNDVLDNRKKKL